MQSKRIPLPSGCNHIQGPRRQWGHTHVKSAGKPPKLRWQPGSFVRVRGHLWEIIYAYRLQSEPSEWHFALERREELRTRTPEFLGTDTQEWGHGISTPRIVYELFRSWYDAENYFHDLPVGGIDRSRVTYGNKFLMQNAELVSSGEVLPGTAMVKV